MATSLRRDEGGGRKKNGPEVTESGGTGDGINNPLSSKATKPSVSKFLGYSMTWHKEPRLKVAPESVRRLKDHIRELLRMGRGRAIGRVITDLVPIITGWTQYYRLATVKNTFETLDEWLRRRLRCILWRQWKKPKTRVKKLTAPGIDTIRAHKSAYNGRDPWWNAGASHMNAALPVRWFTQQGLVSFLARHRSSNHFL